MLNTDMLTLANQISLPRAVRENERLFFDAIKQWLRDRPNWLLVLDHLQDKDITLIDLLIPRSSSGHVLLTTRTHNTKKRASVLFVPSMDDDAGALFLLRRMQTLSDQALLKQAPEGIADQARELSHILDGFPLALDQAGAYLLERGGGLANYLKLCKQQRALFFSVVFSLRFLLPGLWLNRLWWLWLLPILFLISLRRSRKEKTIGSLPITHPSIHVGSIAIRLYVRSSRREWQK